MNPETLVKIQKEVVTANKAFTGAMKRRRKDADRVLMMEITSVMDKDQISPSGDKRDFSTLCAIAQQK